MGTIALMQFNNIQSDYFEWLESLISNGVAYEKHSYHTLFTILHSTKFYCLDFIPKDSNRENDGYSLRYRYGNEFGYSTEEIENYISQDCSVFEMMIALSIRIEEDIMDNPVYGNRVSQWFWSMIASLGLADEDDINFNLERCNYILTRFLNRQYKPNGEGGLFTLVHPDCNLTNIEIWWQANRFCNEQLEITS